MKHDHYINGMQLAPCSTQTDAKRLFGGASFAAPDTVSTKKESDNSRSDVARAFYEDGACKTHIGGQALIEGVMMRGKNCWAVGVRQADGTLFAHEYPLSKKGNRPAWFSWPLVRGCVALVDSLALGFKALEIAANKAFDDEDDGDEVINAKSNNEADFDELPRTETENEDGFGKHPRAKADDEDTSDEGLLSKAEMTLAMVLGVVLAVALFILLPAVVSNVLVGEYEQNPFVWNIVDGVLRVAIFIFYVWLIGRMSDIKRMFSYHGAEHKTIHCYEHGLELTPENARQFPRLHVRCGTAFLIMVMLIAIVVYTVIPLDGFLAALGITGPAAFVLLIVVRIVFLPVIAGLSYEITVKWAGSHPENPVVQVVLWPGMQMQRLTTNEPDDSMLECAIAAMKLVLENEK